MAPFSLLLRDSSSPSSPDTTTTTYSPSTLARIDVFLSFQLFGLIGSLLLISVSLYSSRITRHMTWFSFMFAWAISCASYALLLLAGQIHERDPGFGVCFTQTVLVYGAPPLTAAASMGLVVQIWFNTRFVLLGTRFKHERYWAAGLLIFPYVLHAIILIEALAIGVSEPESIRRIAGSGMYCNTSNPIPGRISTGLVVVLMIPTAIIEGLSCNLLRKHWIVFKKEPTAIALALRVLCFMVFGLFATVLSLVFFFQVHHGSDLNIVFSTIPVAAVLLFGTQRDLLQVYMFWKKPAKQLEADGKVDLN